MPSLPFFVGTYTRSSSRGIYAVRLDPETGGLSVPELAAETPSPTYLAFSPDRKFLYAVRNTEDLAAAFAVEEKAGRLRPLPARDARPAGRSACHLTLDRTGRTLLLADYHAALVAAASVRPDGTLGEPRLIRHSGRGAHPARQAAAHPHCVVVSPDNRFALVCDLGLDRIFTYRLDPAAAELVPGDPPAAAVDPGLGPRHLAFGPDARRAYAICELGNVVLRFDYDPAGGRLAQRQSISTLPPDFQGESTAAAIRFHPNGRYLYGSNRGHDSIAVFAVAAGSGELSPVEIVPCGGKGPRDFSLSPDGAWLVSAHQDSDSLTVFRVDPASGRLARIGGSTAVPMPVCVLF